MDVFPIKLKRLRESHGLNRAELAEKLNVSAPTISNYESGKKTPNIDMLRTIADYFDVQPAYFLYEDEDTSPGGSIDNLEKDFSDGVVLLRRANEELSKKDKERLLNIIKTYLD